MFSYIMLLKVLIILALLMLGKSDGQVSDLNFKTFNCRSNNETINYDHFCDGIDDCLDKSDEKRHVLINDPLATWQSCINPTNRYRGSCLVERNLICREDIVCSNLTPCDLKCDSHYKCQNSKCVKRKSVCNSNPCDGCKEDHGWKNGIGFKCFRNGEECVLPQQLVHDDISDCDGGIDMCFGARHPLNASSRNEIQHRKNLYRDKCFMCLDDTTIIPLARVCDKIIDCPDLSDECLCEDQKPSICQNVISYQESQSKIDKGDHPTRSGSIEGSGFVVTRPWKKKISEDYCNVGDVKCKNGKCIRRESICDGIKDCQEDERFEYCRGTILCGNATKYEKSCRCYRPSTSCVNFYGVACDGIADCPIPPHIFRHFEEENTFPDDECKAFCYNLETNFTCKENFVSMIGPAVTIHPCEPVPFFSENGSEPQTMAPPGPDEVEGTKLCDGREDCAMGDDEFYCGKTRFRCNAKRKGLISIKREQLCDGVEDCKDGVDETAERCGNTRFHCPALGGRKVSIDRKFYCDYRITCDDGSDESNCTDDRFYCENGDPLFVKGRRKFDGRGDCSDWSDECPMTDQSADNGFSSRYELIANPILRALVWIMGILSVGGNATVLYREGKKMRNIKNLSSIAVANRLLVLNLAASDVLMGIYLIALGIAGLSMQGIYCSRDLVWRSSTSCNTLGVLAVLSSETSVITMVLLTACRLYAVANPFKSANQPRKRVVFCMILAAWMMSLFVALFPFTPSMSGIFVTHAEFEYTPYSRNAAMSLDKARELFQDLLTYDRRWNMTLPENFNVEEMSWSDIESFARVFFVHEHFKIVKEFGYYSIESVCIPKFFVSRSDRAWGFSFFVNLFNFCAFMFVASAYAAIYAKSRKKAHMRSSAQNADAKGMRTMQRKILRLIVTDFCCWIPICLMAFSKLGGADLPNTAYVFAAIVLLPINSAVNPLLYSDLPDVLYNKFKNRLKLHRQKTLTSSTSSKHTLSTRPDHTNIAFDAIQEKHFSTENADKKVESKL